MSGGLHVVEFSRPGHRARIQVIEEGHPELRGDLKDLLTRARLAPGPHADSSDPVTSYLSRPDLGPLVLRGAEGRRITLEFME